MRVHMVRIVRAELAAPFSGRSGRLELIQQQQVIVAGQRGVIMRGRKRSRLWLPARGERERARQAVHAFASGRSDANTDEALLALVRLLARQAAREVFDAGRHGVRIVPSKRAANESRHLRPVFVGEPARRLDR